MKPDMGIEVDVDVELKSNRCRISDLRLRNAYISQGNGVRGLTAEIVPTFLLEVKDSTSRSRPWKRLPVMLIVTLACCYVCPSVGEFF